MSSEHAGVVADHLVYATLAGHAFAGLPRLVPIAEYLSKRGCGGEISITRRTARSASIDGANVIGYVTSLMAVDTAVELARTEGIGVVGLSNSWFSGMLRYYVERAADAGFIAMHAANAAARVAPYGGIDPLLGTNPMAFAFPAKDRPLVIDFATSSISWGDVLYHQQLGEPLPSGHAVDAEGSPTTDPTSAIAGAFLPWGGVRGSSLSIVVQALGILAGSDPVISDRGKWGYFFLVIDPAILMDAAEFEARISQLRETIETSRPANQGASVFAPGSRSHERVTSGIARDWIEVADEVYDAVRLGKSYV
jgi:LDH2 family malate/lactate/ureidoglycolate dehydrogenase